MNKSELIDKMAKETGLTKKDTEKALAAFTTIVSKELSKSNDVQVANYGIELKTEIEKIREQIQNIE